MTDLTMTGGTLQPVTAFESIRTWTEVALNFLPSLNELKPVSWQRLNVAHSVTQQDTLRLADISKREAVEVVRVDISDVAVLPGKHATDAAIAEDKRRASLIDLAQRFFSEGHSRQVGRSVHISRDTMNSAIALFASLPLSSKMPKISPDGEGGLVMVWEDDRKPLLAILDGWTVHLIVHPATDQTEYFEDIRYDREQIPIELLTAIPA